MGASERDNSSAAAATKVPSLCRTSRRESVAAIFATTAFGAAGVWLCLHRDDSVFLFLGLDLVLVGLGAMGVIHRRRVCQAGPPDPSAAWQFPKRADRGRQVFAYPRGALWAIRTCSALTLLFGPAVYLGSHPRPVGAELWWLAAFAGMVSGAFFVLVLACERYRVEVSPDSIVHYRLRSPLKHAFQMLGSVALLEGGGRGPRYVLAIYDTRGRCVDSFADTLDGFNELVAMTKEYAFAAGVAYRYRDKWGAWTD